MKKVLIRGIIVLTTILHVAVKNVQSQTTTGTDFWMGFTYAFQPGETGTEYKIWISSVTGATGVVSVPLGAWSTPFTVAANGTAIVTIPYNLVQNESSESIRPKGVHIISNNPVSVAASEYSIVRTEATLVMPTPVLGTDYYVLSYPGFWSGQSHFQIVATQDNTAIQITPSNTTMGNKPAGTPFTITLDSGEVYLVRAKNGFTNAGSDDLTGTHIVGTDPCKKFAVFAGAAESYVPTSCGTADPLYEELLPVNNWGKEFIVPPFFSHTGSVVRIVASQANTSVVIDGGAPITLNAGQFNEQMFNGSAHCIVADKPVQVAQYMKGNSCSGGSSQKTGDPDMLIVNSTDQFIQTVTFRGYNTGSTIGSHYVNVTMKTAHTSQLKLNGAAISPTWTAVPSCSGYSYAAVNVTNNATHTLSADSGFVATLYGYGTGDESYSRSLGFSISPPTETVTICNGASTTLTAPGSGTYVWAPGGATTSSITVSPSTTTTYTVTVSNGICAGSGINKFFVVQVNTCGFNVSANSESICAGACVTLTATTSGGTAPFSYLWNTGATTSSIAPCPSATTTYTVVVSDGSLQTKSATAVVTVSGGGPANAGPDANICAGSSTTLNASGGGTYSWSPATGLSNPSIANPVASPTATTTYTLTVGSGSCSATDVIVITVNPAPVVTVTPPPALCSNISTSLTASGASTYTWSPATGLSSTSGSTVIATPSATITYTIVGTSGGCTASTTVVVTRVAAPTANFTMSPSGIISPKTLVSFTDLSTGGGTLFWDFGDPNSGIENNSSLTTPTHLYATEGNYCIALIISNSSCADTATQCIDVIGEPIIHIPNVFTPNGDGINDWFYITHAGIKELRCEIYDRWGLKVSEWDTFPGGWDGRVKNGNGPIAPDGVYYFIMKAVPENGGDVIEEKGFLQLLGGN